MRSVLISDFGGVLTSPLQEGFLAYQEESGVSLEELGKAMGLAAEEHGDHPLFVLERGEITETEFATGSSATWRTGSTSPGCARSTSSASRRTGR